MEIRENELLARHVTMRIGGVAERFCIPESEEELREIIMQEKQWRILSGGSNVLINDAVRFPCVISMKKACREFSAREDQSVYVGASLRIQDVIRRMSELGQGGFEFLYSLPALMGGVICMNAGRGSDRKSISEFIVDVRAMDAAGKIHVIPREECSFSFRKSRFQQDQWIILGATLRGKPVTREESQNRIDQRLQHCKARQDMRYPNFGSVFSKNNARLMKLVRLLSRMDRSCVRFSDKTPNWLQNTGNGTYRQACRKIENVKKMHKVLGKACECEVMIWEA